MIFTRLYLLDLLIKIIFLFNQTTIKINTHIKFIIENKQKHNIYNVTHIRNIILK